MNMSDLLTVIKMDLGIYMYPLPMENPDQMLADVIKMKSLRTMSQLFPFKYEYIFELDKLECVREGFKESTYILPSIYGDKPILSVTKVEPWNDMYNGSNFLGSPIVTNSMSMYNDLMSAQTSYDLLSTVAPPFSYKFTPPNSLTIFNMGTFSNRLKVELALIHADNLSTIKPTMEDSFIELAKLDCKIFLYNNLKHFDNISTAYGNINLRLDEWSNAESERKDLVSRWEEEFHLDLDAMIVM